MLGAELQGPAPTPGRARRTLLLPCKGSVCLVRVMLGCKSGVPGSAPSSCEGHLCLTLRETSPCASVSRAAAGWFVLGGF